jgi:hypothetical protein
MGKREQTPSTFARESQCEHPDHHHVETTMKTDLYSRMFSRLEDLIPELSSVAAPGAAFYASPRSPADMALFCSVASCSEDELELELAKDEVVAGREQAVHWMKFRVNRKTRTARLVACQTEATYETIHSETIYPQSRHLPLNSFAVNWLSILVNLQFAFRAIVPAPSFN